MNDKKFVGLIVCAMIFVGFVNIGIVYYMGPKQINVDLTLNDEPFVGWVEVMNPSGEYLEEQTRLVKNGHYISLREYGQGRILYVIAWVDLMYQIGDELYVLGMRVPVTVQMDRQSFELSDGKLWLYPDNTTMFGMDW